MSCVFTADCDRFYCNWSPVIAPHVGFTADHNCCQRNLAPAGAGVQLITVTRALVINSHVA